MSIIELKNISKSYGLNCILKEFNLNVEKGEIIAVTGNSGAGKSTLLNIIGLLDIPDSGQVIIDGIENIRLDSRQAMILQRNTIGYLFQNYALVDNLTVDKNLDIALEYTKTVDKKQTKMDALNKVRLSDKLKNKVYQLSGGEQQRVAIARLMLKPCEIILADEPTGSLDSSNKNIIINLLKELNSQGKTILIVTHDKQVADSCSRTIVL